MSEADPTGRGAHDAGAKLDANKPEPELIQRGFARALDMVAQVGTYGARKYTRDGWESVPDGERRYTNALYRHLGAEHRGERCDRDTNIPHAAHTAWNALARLELMLRAEESDVFGIGGAPPESASGAVTFGPNGAVVNSREDGQ